MAPKTIQERIDADRKAAIARPQMVRHFRNYARGKQRSTLTTAQAQILRGVTGQTFCDNVCKMVLLAAASRLRLVRFDVDDTAVLDYLRELWTLTSLPLLAHQVHWAALRDGNHCVALSFDNDKGQVRFARERWWDGKSGIFVAYDDEDTPTYAVKEWQAEVGLRRVVWFPDRIERYIADGNGWRGYALDQETPWRSPWTIGGQEGGEPIGLPVVHFRNVYMPEDSSDNDADSSYGVSELDGGVLGLQDEVNDIQRDITASARYTGYQMMFATGVTLEKDADAKPIPLKVEPGAVFTSENAAAAYGTLPAGSLEPLDLALSIKLRAISRMTATPLHEITGGDWPSGNALLEADKPIIKKVEAMTESFGPAWSSLAHKATILANAFAGANLDTGALITAIFAALDSGSTATMPVGMAGGDVQTEEPPQPVAPAPAVPAAAGQAPPPVPNGRVPGAIGS